MIFENSQFSLNNQSLLKDKIIRHIQELGGEYEPESSLSLRDQLFVCESIVEAPPVKQVDNNGMISVNGSVNDSYKRNVNFELTQSKLNVVIKLKKCTYKTSPKDIAIFLEQFFIDFPSKSGHWLYIAQHWTPRTIVRVIEKLIKLDFSGRATLHNPAGYFTYLIKFRKKRRSI